MALGNSARSFMPHDRNLLSWAYSFAVFSQELSPCMKPYTNIHWVNELYKLSKRRRSQVGFRANDQTNEKLHGRIDG